MKTHDAPSAPAWLPVIPDAIPAALRKRKQFVGWRARWREGKAGKPGKWTKVPYQQSGDKPAKSTDPATWSKLSFLLLRLRQFDGVGFCLGDGVCGIDLDHCREPTAGTIEPWALEIVAAIPTYWEVTPSGCGLRAFAFGQLPGGGIHRGKTEIYDAGRYLTVTGHHLDGTAVDLTDCQEAITALYARVQLAGGEPIEPPADDHPQEEGAAKQQRVNPRKLKPAAAKPGSNGHVGPGGPTDAQVVAKAEAASTGAEFSRLWSGIAAGYESQSEADLALCNHLAFFSGPDESRLDGLFRKSGLFRDKWDEPHYGDGTTYGQATVRQALANRTEFYGWTEKRERRAAVVAGERANEADDDPHRLARVNLEQYAHRTGGRTVGYWRDEWYLWKRNAYRKITDDEFRAKVTQAVKDEFDRLNIEKVAEYVEQKKKGQVKEADDKGPPVATKVTKALVSNVIQATSGIVCVSSDTEPNTWLPTGEPRNLVSMANGLLDVDAALDCREDCLTENTPEWWSMVSLPFAWDASAECPQWEAMLERNLEMDPERIKQVQEWAGYLLLPETGEQKFMILEGEGANGKSAFLTGLTAMLGEDNVSAVPLEVFGDRFSRTDTLGKLLNVSSDCGEVDKVAEGYIKSFSAGDRMYFDRKGIQGLNCRPTARLMIACNNRPRFNDKSDGVYRRMLIVPWRIQIQPGERIKGMTDADWWEATGELPGIFNWALRGLVRLRIQQGFTRSEVGQRALADYREEMNPAGAFLGENVEACADGQIHAGALYKHYSRWARTNGYHPLSEKSFGKEVRRRFPTVERRYGGPRSKRYYLYQGIIFSQDEIEGESTYEPGLF